MKKIAIYFTDPLYDDYPFNEEEYREAYHILAGLLDARGAGSVIVRGQETYRGGTSFQGGWEYRDGTFRRTEDLIEAELIFNRGRFQPEPGIAIINDPAFNALCDDKSATYERYRAYSPMSYTIANADEREECFQKIPSELVVSKPIDGLGGHGIVIGTREEIRRSGASFPSIIQEFIDTSGGIPGICEGMHDFRIVAVRDKVVFAWIRFPKKGSYLANISQGGSSMELDIARIPADALAIFRAVDNDVARYERRVYCVDVARNKDGRWVLIELNAQPGLSSYDYEGRNDPDGKGEGSKRYFHGLADLLASAA